MEVLTSIQKTKMENELKPPSVIVPVDQWRSSTRLAHNLSQIGVTEIATPDHGELADNTTVIRSLHLQNDKYRSKKINEEEK